MNARGVSFFQQRSMSWSTRYRGSVHRSHIMSRTRAKDFDMNQKRPSRNGFMGKVEPRSRPNGGSQPPRKNVVAMAATTNMFAYSARKKKLNRIPEYSVW